MGGSRLIPASKTRSGGRIARCRAGVPLREDVALAIRQLAVVSLAVLLLGVMLGCSGGSQSPAAGSSVASSTSTRSVSKAAPTPPPAPGSLTALAASSVPLVAQLHNTAALMTRRTGLPAGTLTTQAVSLKGKLTGLAKRSSASSGSGSQFHDVLLAYADLAGKLNEKSAPDARKLSADLAALDKKWKTVLGAIGTKAHVNLLATLPPLLLPHQ
jgi:hypothetical protein